MHRGRADGPWTFLDRPFATASPGRRARWCGVLTRSRANAMALWLERRAADFDDRFAALLVAKREASEDVNAAVAGIIARVRCEQNAGLIDLTPRYDRLDLRQAGLCVRPEEIAEARAAADPNTLAALEFARDRILAHHRRQLPADDHYIDAL